jgi:metal-responsive CopG/Arc/MetJ family transcriptional regulator
MNARSKRVQEIIERDPLGVGAGNVRRNLTLPKKVVAELDAWRAEQRPIPTESQAVSELLRQALQRWREQQEQERKR